MESITRKIAGIFMSMFLLFGAASVKANTVTDVWVASWFAFVAWTPSGGGATQTCFESVSPSTTLKDSAPGTLGVVSLLAEAKNNGTPVFGISCENGNDIRFGGATQF